jgi:hypothetical protein
MQAQSWGAWILSARSNLENQEPIDLTGLLPTSLRIIIGNNVAQQRDGFQLSQEQRRPIDELIGELGQVMVLGSNNPLVRSLRAFWNRTIPIWEGHTREASSELVTVAKEQAGNAEALAHGVISFVGKTAIGFTNSTHGERLIKEIRETCSSTTTGKPANIQTVAREILDNPSHIGVAGALGKILELSERREAGFDAVKIDHRVEFRDAIRLRQFACPDEGFAEIARKRSYGRPTPPSRVLSSIHKAKGLECDNVVIMSCDESNFRATQYARCRMYVALSRAKQSLTLVMSDTKNSPLFRLR